MQNGASANMQQMNVHSYGVDEVTLNSQGGLQSRVRSAYKKKSYVYATIAAVVLLLVISIAVPVSKNNKSSSTSSETAGLTSNGPLIPPAEVKDNILQSNKKEFASFLVSLYENLGLKWESLSNEDSPQFKALNWICGRDEYAHYKGAQRIQRFVLASFYYATFYVPHEFLTSPTDWSSSDGWISDSDECSSWEGITCNANGQVTAIQLPEHHISGSLPVELALLTALEELDFTSNYIYMEDEAHTLWTHMKTLKKLLFEDNFMVTTTGLPTQFSGLVSLEKLQLSYNLLQGTLVPEVFTSLQALQHLEIESNYLSGEMPSTVGQLPNLVYLYARRNILSIVFHNMIVSSSYPSLFSLWLDNNNVTGSIPAAIGELTDLASLSVTNATLSGPIPTEFGNLSSLRRVWLYENQLNGAIPTQLNQLTLLEVFEIHDNDLTGSMPTSICSAVTASSYQYRSLTADCDSVQCECCTSCYEG